MARETSRREITALVVGRDDAWRDAMHGALARLGIDAVGANCLADALDTMRRAAFDVAIVALTDPAIASDLPALVKAAPGLLVVVTGGAGECDPVERAVAGARDAARRTLVRLANHLVHDLNNPLGGLKLYVRLLERSLAQAKIEEAPELAGKIGRAVDQLAEILAEIRRYDGLPAPERAGSRLERLIELSLAPPPAERGDE